MAQRPTTLREYTGQSTAPDPRDPIPFAGIIKTAIHHTPGGVLGPADRAGLVKRGMACGLTREEAEQAINAECQRPRHPVTRGIE